MKIFPGTLRSRMLWAGLVPLGLAAFVLTLVEPRLVRKAAAYELRDVATRIVSGWEAFDVLARSPEEFQRAILLSASAPAIRSAALLRKSDGLVLAASQNRLIGRPFEDLSRIEGNPAAAAMLADPVGITGLVSKYEGRVFRIALPLRVLDRQVQVGTELAAVALIEFDPAKSEAENRALLRPIIWGGFATAILLIAISQASLIAGVVRPLEKIARLARRGEKLELSGLHNRSDEVGSLVRSLYAAQAEASEERDRLEQNRRRLQDILEGFGDPVAMVDGDRNFTYLNRAARTRLGWEENDISTSMETRVVDSALGDFRAMVERAVATPAEVISGEVEVWGVRMVRESATLSVRVLPEPDGRLQALLHLHLTTERRLAEAALREREEIFSAIVEQAPDAIALAEIHTGRFAEFNRQAHEMLGYTREEYAELGIGDIEANFPPEQVQRILGEFLKIGHGTVETRHRHRDGRLLDVVVTMRCLKIRGTGYVAAIWRDVTEAKKHEAQRRELSLVVEQSPISIVITDLAGRIEYTNPYFTTITGYDAQHVLGRNPSFLKSGLTAPAVFTELWSTLTQGKVWHGEMINRSKSGKLLVELVTITPLADERGRITRYAALQQDITERRRVENSLAESEARFRELFELAPLPLAFSSGSGDIIGVNRQFTQVLGYTQADIPTVAHWFERAYPDPAYRKNRLEEWDRVVREREADHCATTPLTNEITCRDGSIRIAEISGVSDRGGLIVAIVDLTERLNAAAELRASRDRLLVAESIAKLGHWDVELETGLVRMSNEARSIYEIGPDEAPVTLERMMQQVHPGDAPTVLPACRQALQARTDHVSNHRLKAKSTGRRYVEVKFVFQNGTDGQPWRLFGTTQDVTSSKVVELELHALVKELRVMHDIARLLDDAPDETGQLVEGIAGLLPGIVQDSEAAQATVEIEGHRRTRGAPGACTDAATVEIRINGQSGGSITMGYVAAALAEPTEMIVADLETLRDIARSIGHALSAKRARTALERFNADLEEKVRRRTAELAARHREMQGLFNSIPDLVLHLRTDGTVVHCHRSTDSATLAAMADPAKQPVVQNESLGAACAELGTRITKTCLGTTEAILDHNSRSVYVELRWAAISDTEFVVFVRDISARKQQESDAAAMFERERQVSEMKTRFISVASHEFRTPMAAAMGSAELLQNHYDRLAASKREELFGRIQTAMQRMTGMLDDILTMSRLDAGRLAPTLVPVDLPAFVQGVVDEIRAGDRDAHHFDLETVGTAGAFVSDPKLLHHIVSNLLSNSVRYSPRDSVVTVRIQQSTNRVRIEIVDHGIGIPEADLPRIFEPFERASNVGTIKGTGLGLSIVKRMTEMLDGRVSVESAVGQGTRFILDLPVLAASNS